MLEYVFFLSIYIQTRTEFETNEAQLLSREINMLEGKIAEIKGLQEKQNLLLTKREIIQALQASRHFIVRIFEDTAKAVPDGVLLLSMQRKDNSIVLEGVSNSNSRISVFYAQSSKIRMVNKYNLTRNKNI